MTTRLWALLAVAAGLALAPNDATACYEGQRTAFFFELSVAGGGPRFGPDECARRPPAFTFALSEGIRTIEVYMYGGVSGCPFYDRCLPSQDRLGAQARAELRFSEPVEPIRGAAPQDDGYITTEITAGLNYDFRVSNETRLIADMSSEPAGADSIAAEFEHAGGWGKAATDYIWMYSDWEGSRARAWSFSGNLRHETSGPSPVFDVPFGLTNSQILFTLTLDVPPGGTTVTLDAWVLPIDHKWCGRGFQEASMLLVPVIALRKIRRRRRGHEVA
jgi:hypothetical protein